MAANAGAIRAGRAFVEAFLDDKQLIRGLKSVQRRLSAFGKSVSSIGRSMAGIGLAAAAPLAAATKAFMDTGDALDKMAARTGVSVEALSALNYAAGQSGASAESMEKALRGMSKLLVEAAGGSQEAQETLQELGISLDDLKGLSPEKQFLAIGEAISRVQDPAKRVSIAMKAFGKSGAELLPLFSDGAKGVEGLMERARELGLVMTKEDSAAATTLGDRLADLWAQFRRIGEVVGAALAPRLTDLADKVIANVARLIDWINNNRQLIVTMAEIVAATVAVGVAAIAAGQAITFFSDVLGSIADTMTLLVSGVEVATVVITGLASPIGLVSAAILGLAGYFAYTSGVIEQLTTFLGGLFGNLGKIVQQTFDGIKAAMAAGDFKLAADLLWAGLNLVFLEGMTKIEFAWDEWTAGLEGTWLGMLTNISDSYQKVVDYISGILVEFGIVEGIDPSNVEDVLNTLKEDNSRRGVAANAARGERIARLEEELIAARDAFERNSFLAEGAKPGGGFGPGKIGPVSPELQAILDSIQSGGGAAASRAASVVGGTFSSEAARQIVGGRDEELKELKAIAANTGTLARRRLAYS